MPAIVLNSLDNTCYNTFMELRKSFDNETESLVAISKAAFDSDIEVGAKTPCGPPGYNSVPWHREQQRNGRLYTFTDGQNIIGGAILYLKMPTLYIGRIFIDPKYFRRGFGSELINQIEELFCGVEKIKLDTPVFNVRTLAFYRKCGYREVSRDSEFVYFQKTLNSVVN